MLQLNGGDDLMITTDGAFSFATLVADGSAYDVTVRTQPSGGRCTVTNGSATVASANVSDVQVSAAN